MTLSHPNRLNARYQLMSADILRLETTRFTVSFKAAPSASKGQASDLPYSRNAGHQTSPQFGPSATRLGSQPGSGSSDIIELKQVSVSALADDGAAHVVRIDPSHKESLDGGMV